MQLPEFVTARLHIRPRVIDDFEACFAMDRDPEVTKYNPGPWDDAVLHEQFLRERIEQPQSAGMGYWSIFSRQLPRQFIGWVLLLPSDTDAANAEIGWRLNRKSWGYGFAPEAAMLIVKYAFEILDISSIEAHIHSQNVASIRVATKIGMQFTGVEQYEGVRCKSYALNRAGFVDAKRWLGRSARL